MELVIKNIGKMDSASMEIKGITVIAGYNSTGKSTLCRSLYSILDTFSNVNQKIIAQRKNSLFSAAYKWEPDLLDDGLDDEQSNKVIELLVRYILDIEKFEDESSMRNVITDIARKCEVSFSEDAIELFISKYNEIVGKDKAEYMQFITSSNIKNIFREQMGHVNYKKKNSVIELSDGQKKWGVVFRSNELVRYNYKYGTLKRPVYIEPRSVLDNCDVSPNRILYVRKSIDSIQNFLIRDEYNDIKLTLEEYQERQKNLQVIKEILHEVTNGQLVSKQDGGLVYSEEGLKDEIICGNIASGLKPFLIIQRLIENGTLGAGRVLIIDEPEVNLHPEWQLSFAKILVLLNMKLDIKVVLSTHSPYFLRAIEYYMEDYENGANGKYYITVKQDNELYTVEDVTDNLERIYKTLYRPLEEVN